MAINERATVEVQVNGQQAKQELRDLESYANSLKGRLAEAYKAGDTKQIKKLEAELKKTNAELKTMRTNAKNIDFAMQNLSLAGPKELRQLLKDINAKLNSGHIKRGSAEWKMYQERLKLVNAELRKINAEVQETQSWLTRFNNGFSKWGGLLASGAAAITGVSFALSKLRNNRDDKEDSAANLKALTGLDDNSIKWLTRQAEILSTAMDKTGLRVTQSSRDILEAYMLVGSNKPELLNDKEALNAVTVETMRLSAASKMELAKSVEATTTALNQYGAGADQAARYVNVLAAGSKFGASNVEQQTAAILKAGTIAASSNISLEELVGTIEMLGEKGMKNEIAGTGLKTFFTRLSTGAIDTNPKVVGLSVALENLNKKVEEAESQTVGGGTTLLKKLFGDEGMVTAMILTQNTEKVKEYTQAVTGTSVAMEQAAINSDTAKAKRAQYINQIKEAGIILMEKLNPSLSALTGWTTKLIKAAPELIDWLQKYGKVLAYAIIVVASYTAANKLQWLWLNKVKTETGQYIVIQKLKEFWDKAITASTWLYIAATSALTGKINQAKLAMQAFFLVTKFHPLGLLLTVITAVAGGLYLLATRTKKAKTLTEEFFSSVSDERNELNKIYNQLLKTNEKTADRIKLINEFNSQFGKYLTNLLDEKSTVDDIKKAYREATSAMNDHYARELLASRQSEVVKESLDAQSEALKKSVDFAINATRGQKARLAELINDVTNQVITDNPEYGVGNVRQKIYEQINREFGSGAAYNLFGGSQGWENFSKEISPFIKAADETINKVAKLKDELAPFIKNLAGTPVENGDEDNDDKKKCPKCGNYPCTCKKSPQLENNKLLAEEKRYQNELKQLKEQYLSSDTMTQKEYQEFLTDLELRHLDRKLDIAGLEPEKREEIEKRVLDIQMKFKEKCLAEDKDEKKQYLSNQQKAFNVELAEESRRYKLGYMSREEYLQSILQLLTKYKIGVQKITENATGEEKEAVDSYIEYVMKALQKAFDQTEEKNKTWQDKVKDNWAEIGKWSEMSTEQQSSMLSSLLIDIFNFRDGSMSAFETVEEKFEATFMFMSGIAQDFGVSLGKTLTGEEEAMGEFLQNLIVMVLDTIEKMLIAYISMTTIRNVGELGIWGLAKAAGEIALITAAFETAKSAIGNFYTGGFTSPGEWDKPQGIVHSNEFVANRFAVANPEILPVLKLLDTAQKNNTVGKLTSQDVSSVLRNGGQNQAAAVEVIQTTDPEIKQLIAECTTVMQTVKKRFEKRIVAETYLTGKGGINQAQKEYNRLNNNKSRNKQ